MLDQPADSQVESDDPFETTRWSLVLAVGQDAVSAGDALESLCQTYWYPLYAYVRRRVADIHEAQDLTQAFFEQLLEKRTIENADPHRGRFRAFLLTACKRFLVNEWHKKQAVKRGGGRPVLSLDFDSAESKLSVAAVDTLTPELIYEQQWAMVLLASVLEKLRQEYQAREKHEQFDHLKVFLSGSSAPLRYAQAAELLGITESAVKIAAHRMRTRYRELIRAEIAQTVESSEDVEDEIRRLFEVL